MVFLIAASAFFSGSEAAFFSLSNRDRTKLNPHRAIDQAILRLLDDADRLLTSILFWNLSINIAFFSLASLLSAHFADESIDHWLGPYLPALVPVLALLMIIVLGELIPKNFAVLQPLSFSRVVAGPLAIAVRVAYPLSRVLRMIAEFSRRIIWPGLKTEPYLDIADLQRAVEHTTDDALLLDEECLALQNIIQLGNESATDWMQPRSHFPTYPAISTLDRLRSKKKSTDETATRYALLTHPLTGEITHSLQLANIRMDSKTTLIRMARPVLGVAWCASLASVLDQLQRKNRDMAVVVCERGDAIGVLSVDDIAESIFDLDQSAGTIGLSKPNIHQIDAQTWEITGSTSLRRIERATGLDLSNDQRIVTLSGLIHEQLKRIAKKNDECRWNEFHAVVTSVPRRGAMLIRITIDSNPSAEKSS
jgi:CBS domain containing-hemolysin-like protein